MFALKETKTKAILDLQRAETPLPPAAFLTIRRIACGRKEDELCISRGFPRLFPQSPMTRCVFVPTIPSISLRGMEQIFPSPVDNVNPMDAYASDMRPTVADRPWVMCNMISSVDGAVAIDGVSGGLGGPGDKVVFKAIRAVPDLIVVASGTAIAENYRKPQTSPETQLVRIERGQLPFPRLAIVTRSLRIEPTHRVFDPTARPMIITTADADPVARNALEPVADIVVAGEREVDLNTMLTTVRSNGVKTVLLEGGPTLNGAFVDADLVDELCLSFAPTMLGGTSPRIVAASTNTVPRGFRLDRILHDEGYLFHRYLRTR